MKKFIAWMGMVVWAVLPSAAFSGLTPIEEASFDYQDMVGNIGASVNSWVTDNGNETFTYYYQIHNVTSGYKINYFQFSVPETASYTDWGLKTSWGEYEGYVMADWHSLEIGGDVYGMGASFTSGLTSAQDSMIFLFTSDTGPVESSGMLAGFNPAGGPIALYGGLYAPVPEPMTLLFLAAGGGFVIKMK